MKAEGQINRQSDEAAGKAGKGVVQIASQPPSVLVAIASYGTAQDHYLERVLAEYRQLRMPVKVVVLSNVDKPVQGAEVVAGLPSRDPYSLPFAHKKFFGENADRYDLFIYSEDDVLITERHVEAFLNAQSRLGEDEIPGFIRSETSPQGKKYTTSIHHHFRWLPGSVVQRGGELFARLSNQHSGCFMVTRKQLRKAIASGGFLVSPHAEVYGMLETAASDLYTQCGLERLICVSRIHDFIVPHLPNKYYAQMGIPLEILEEQVRALRDVGRCNGWTGALFEPGSRVTGFQWSKDLYERPDEELLRALPPSAKSVLSVGCGWGENEAWLNRNGINVCAVPLDVVFAALVRQRGIRTVEGPLHTAIEKLGGERFDVVLLPDVLHLVENPVEWMERLRSFLGPEGWMLASVANTCDFAAWVGDWREGRRRPLSPSYRKSGVQAVSPGRLRRWCRSAGMEAVKIVPVVEGERRALRNWGLTALEPAFASRFILSARPAK